MGLGWETRRARRSGVGRGRRPRLRASNPLAGNSRIALRAPLDRSASRRRRRRRTAGPVWSNQDPTPKPRRLSPYLIAAKRPLFPSASLGKSVEPISRTRSAARCAKRAPLVNLERAVEPAKHTKERENSVDSGRTLVAQRQKANWSHALSAGRGLRRAAAGWLPAQVGNLRHEQRSPARRKSVARLAGELFWDEALGRERAGSLPLDVLPR